MDRRMQISVILHPVVPYSIILHIFAKRAQITFGAVGKSNLLPFGMHEQKQKDYFFNDFKTFFL
jgi:hypothetical protein